MSVPTFTLNDGNKIPVLAYGTGSVWKFTDVVPYVEQALEAGFNHLDTAAFYQTEQGVGKGVKESGLDRNELYITTKFGGRGKDIAKEIHVSLENLGVKNVDLYLIHSPTAIASDVEGAWTKMEQVKKDGYAKSIGVSNFKVDTLEAILKTARIPPAVNQIQLHPYNYEEMKPTIEFSKKHGIVIEAYSGLAPITKLPGGPVDAVIDTISKKNKSTPAQVLQQWILSKDIVIVTTSSRRERLKEYLSVLDLSPLSKEDIQSIEAAGAKGAPTVKGTVYLAKLAQRQWRPVLLATLLLSILFVMWIRGSVVYLVRGI